MHSPFPFKLDTEIKRTFRLRSNKQRLEKHKQMALEIFPKWQEVQDTNEGRSGIFITPCVWSITSSMTNPKVKAYNFELKLAFVSMV